jgi:hypothetical protein
LSYAPKGKLPAGVCLIIIGTEGADRWPAALAHIAIGASEEQFAILYWSLWKERWVPFGPFGRTAASVEQAMRIIADAAIFWAGV